MNVSKDDRKQRGLGLWYNTRLRKAKVKVCRPGLRGRRPWTITFDNVSIEEARQKYWTFRKHVLENGSKPGEAIKPSLFRGMPTFDQYIERYGIPGVMNEKTARDQQYIVDRDLRPALGHLPLNRITKAELDALQNSLRARRQSPYTINQKIAVTRKIIRHAFDNEIIDRLPKFPPAGLGEHRAAGWGAKLGPAHQPPPASGQVFPDVPRYSPGTTDPFEILSMGRFRLGPRRPS